jgi:hypothetical protein
MMQTAQDVSNHDSPGEFAWSGRTTLGFSSCAVLVSFGFFKDADSNVAPPPYPGAGVAAGYETVGYRLQHQGYTFHERLARIRAPASGVAT